MKTAVIILNYNDSQRSIDLMNILVNYNLFDIYIIVDNQSKEEQIEVLKQYSNNNNSSITFLYATENKGYGAGNNVGLRYLEDKDVDYVLLINPDIEIPKKSIIDCFAFLQKHPEIAVCSTLMKDKNESLSRNYYDIPTYWSSINWFSQLKKTAKSRKDYDGYFTCGYVRESAAFYNYKYFKQIGFFDEDFFLFDEGPSTSFLFNKLGLKEAIVLNGTKVVHHHTGPYMNRKIMSRLKAARIIYLKKYLHVSKFKILLFRICWINIFIK